MFHLARLCFIIVSFWISKGIHTCPEKDGCFYDAKEETVECRAHLDLAEVYGAAKTLRLCDYDNTTLYLSKIVKSVPNVENITITRSNISYIREPTKDNKIKFLKINNSTLKRIPDNLFLKMRHLREFDARNNSLDKLPARMKHFKDLQAIYLEHNRWNCSLNLDWALDLNKTMVKDYRRMSCHGELYEEKPVVAIAIFLQNSQINCPDYCECTMPKVIRDIFTEKLKPIVEANCSNKELTELPPFLPNHTTILRLENNRISDLTPLLNNRIYRSVIEIYLDHNEVDSIGNLEGAYWLSHFRVFSLRDNKLSRVPIYALDNALQQNPNMPNAVRVFLGGNPWKCDCSFTPHFQEMLMKYEHQISDLDAVKCSFVEDDPNSYSLILSLTRTSVCKLPNENMIRPLDLLNIVLASLIVLILSKLAYDYYHFKKTGRLPWIVMKMP